MAEYASCTGSTHSAGASQPLKDRRTRKLQALFGTIEIAAPGFHVCRCRLSATVVDAVTLSPVCALLTARCTCTTSRTRNHGCIFRRRQAELVHHRQTTAACQVTARSRRRRLFSYGTPLHRVLPPSCPRPVGLTWCRYSAIPPPRGGWPSGFIGQMAVDCYLTPDGIFSHSCLQQGGELIRHGRGGED